MRKWLNIYFSFTKREYNGLVVMVVIIIIITAIPNIYEMFFYEPVDLNEQRLAIRKLELVAIEKKRWKHNRKITKEAKLFSFDPNHNTLQQWQALGFSARQAEVLLRYVEKGGKFRKKEDLQKMYSVSAEMYSRLAPYIHIQPADTIAYINKYKAAHAEFKPVIVTLNTADTIALDAIKGVGPAFARRIFKYRERLGGFYKKEQLLEVFGLDSAKYNEIKDQVTIDWDGLRKIYINRVEFADLKGHPYLNFKQINAIIQFRKQHGNYGNIAELKKVAILSAGTVEKLAPYISFDHD